MGLFNKNKNLTFDVGGKKLDAAALIKKVYKEAKIYAPDNQEDYRNTILRQYGIETQMTNREQTKWAFIVGVVFILIYVAINVFIPKQSQEQYKAFRIFIAFGAAGFGAFLPGLLQINIDSHSALGKLGIRAVGAFAMLLLVYLVDPGKGNVFFEREQKPNHRTVTQPKDSLELDSIQ